MYKCVYQLHLQSLNLPENLCNIVELLYNHLCSLVN